MKNKLFAAIICILATYSTNAQTYQSVISNKSIWTNIDSFSLGVFTIKTIRKEMMQGDTIILGQTYKKIEIHQAFLTGLPLYICVQ